MKKHSVIATILGMLVLFAACSNEVELFADGEGTPIVYALLDCDADTNFVKITHTMGSGDAIANAEHPEQSDYPGKLDVRLTEFCNGDSIRQIILDTITIFGKENGLFYSPAQKLYYTTERLGKNTAGKLYSYRLTAILPDHTLTAETEMVGADIFRVQSSVMDFSGGFTLALHNIMVIPPTNAEIFDVLLSFSFLERRTFTSDSVLRTMTWHMGPFFLFDLATPSNQGAIALPYHSNDLISELENFLGDDTLVPGLRRYILDDPLRVTVTAGGHNLSEYIYLNLLNSNSISDDNAVTYINGGYGVFSSRMTTPVKIMRLGGTTLPELINGTKWGFKYIGGHL